MGDEWYELSGSNKICSNSPSPIFYLDFYLQVQAQIRSKNCDIAKKNYLGNTAKLVFRLD